MLGVPLTPLLSVAGKAGNTKHANEAGHRVAD